MGGHLSSQVQGSPGNPVAGLDEADDQALVVAVQRGEASALDALVQRYHTPLSQFLERMVGEPETALDLTQETFLKMIRALPRYRPRAKFSTWLYTIAANLARDELRRRQVRTEHLAHLEEEERQELPSEPRLSVVDEALGNVTREEVRRALVALSEEHRTVVLLHYFQGLSYREIADVCGCTVGTVGSRLHYAVRNLRQCMDEHTSPPPSRQPS